MVAPSGVVAAGTGCGSSVTLAQGESTQCSFAYSGPDASGDWSSRISLGVTSSDAGFAQLQLQTASGRVLLQCEGGRVGQLVNDCGQSRFDTMPTVPVGTTLFCVLKVLGPDPVTADYACSSGT
jgi:hypothetical protein